MTGPTDLVGDFVEAPKEIVDGKPSQDRIVCIVRGTHDRGGWYTLVLQTLAHLADKGTRPEAAREYGGNLIMRSVVDCKVMSTSKVYDYLGTAKKDRCSTAALTKAPAP